MSRHSERSKENRARREASMARLEEHLLRQESWLTKERAKGVAIACVAIGAVIFGFLQASGAFSLPGK